MTKANPPQESHANDDYGHVKNRPLENSRCRYVVPVTVCKHSVFGQK